MRRIATVTVLLHALSLSAGAPAAAQGLSWQGPLAPGQRVRVWHATGRSPQVGTLVSVGSDSVVLRTSDDAPWAVARASVRSIEQSYPAGTYAAPGTMVGALAGLATGVGVAYYRNECRGTSDVCIWQLAAVLYGAIGTVVGGVIGFTVGKDIVRERWQPAAVPQRVGSTPGANRHVAVWLALRF
jgi:hypothetical protein